MESRSIPDATLLLLHTHHSPAISFDSDGLAVFTFDGITNTEAREILASPQAEVCRQFYRYWRTLLRRMEEARPVAKGATP